MERFHKTLRAEFLEGRSFASLAEAQAALNAWVAHYNGRRPHQGIGMVAPLRRFAAGEPRSVPAPPVAQLAPSHPTPARGAVSRLVGATGKISYCGAEYRVGGYLAAERVEVVVVDGLVEVRHHGVLVAQAAARHRLGAVPTRGRQPRLRAPTAGRPVLRMVDQRGSLSFAGAIYRVGNRFCGQQVEVRLVGDAVEISLAGELIRSHVAKHDPVKEHGAFATPGGRPRKLRVSQTTGVTELLKPLCLTGGET